jgi:hypothetical protein
VEHDRQHCIAKEIADKSVGVGRAKSLRVPLSALSPLRVAVVGLADAGNGACQQEGPRIDFTPEEKLKLLPRDNGSAFRLLVVLKVAITPATRWCSCSFSCSSAFSCSLFSVSDCVAAVCALELFCVPVCKFPFCTGADVGGAPWFRPECVCASEGSAQANAN